MAANSLKAVLPSLQSTKVSREPILITENEGEIFFHTLRGMNTTTQLYVAVFGSVTALIYQLPHPWGAFDGHAITLFCYNISICLSVHK